MSSRHHFNTAKIEEEAARWAARLESGNPSSADLAALNAWLSMHPEHPKALSRYREMSDAFEREWPEVDDTDDVDQFVRQVASQEKWKRRGWTTLCAAAAIAVAVSLWSLAPHSVETQPGERRVLILADGSQVELNAQTKLKIDLGRRVRRVHLLEGEAVFSVAPDRTRPFLVNLDVGTVSVLGTVFNVRQISASSAATVSVLDGNVQVRAASKNAEPVAIGPGNQAALSRETVSVRVISADQIRNLTAWRTGLAAFEAATLREASELFARYHNRAIAVSDDVSELRVGGRYSLDDIEGYLAAVEETLPVRAVRDDRNRVRLLRRSP